MGFLFPFVTAASLALLVLSSAGFPALCRVSLVLLWVVGLQGDPRLLGFIDIPPPGGGFSAFLIRITLHRGSVVSLPLLPLRKVVVSLIFQRSFLAFFRLSVA